MPVNPNRGLHGHIVDDLGRRIVSGELGANSPLDVEVLSEQYGASRGAVREALRVLSGKGMIVARPRRGTFATDRQAWSLLDPDLLRWDFEALPTLDMLEKLSEMRAMVEPAAAELAARRRTADDIEILEGALSQLAHSGDNDSSLKDKVSADILLHTSILRATHNELIGQLVGVIEMGLRVRDELVITDRTLDNFAGHAAVITAIREGDAEAAYASMLTLVEHAAIDAQRLAAHGEDR